MSFWENASSSTKGVIVVGGILLVLLGAMWAGKFGLFSPAIDDNIVTDPGLGAAP